MKKIVMIIFLFISGVIGLILIGNNKIKKIYTEIDGVKYAIYVDGSPSTSFPVGDYKVDVTCENAYGYWDYYQRKIIITDISNNASCNVDFSSIIDNDYLNTYILGLAGSTQGNGKFIHETGEVYMYDSIELIKTFGTTPVYFRNTSSTATTQTEIDSFWTFNSSTGVFTSDPTKFTASGTNNFYHAYMKVPSAGYYQICYTIAQAPNVNNNLYFVKNTTNLSYANASTTTAVSETCYDMGYFESTDYINISERGYSGTSSPIMTFRIEKSNNILQIDAGYRYEGTNPNNYIMFNNELWRIIGVFDETSHGQTGKSLVKIIKNDTLGSFTWNKTSNNDWSNASLNHLLNEQYFDWDTNKSNVSTYCYISNYARNTCDFSVVGIKDGWRNMIKNVTWYLGGAGKEGYTAYKVNNIYYYERNSNAVYTGRPSSTTGNIGLMYESDYLYGALETDCPHSTLHTNYKSLSCSAKNWLVYANECMLDQVSSSSYYVWSTNTASLYSSNSVTSSFEVRPVLYLHEDVYRISGTGSITDPYIIGVASS